MNVRGECEKIVNFRAERNLRPRFNKRAKCAQLYRFRVSLLAPADAVSEAES